MKDFVNQFTGWQVLLFFLFAYLFFNLLLAKRYALVEDNKVHPLDRIPAFLVFLFFGGPLIIINAIKTPPQKKDAE